MQKILKVPFTFAYLYLALLAAFSWPGCQNDLPITAEDGSVWEQVNTPGFGNSSNFSVVAMASYRGFLYAMTRNDAQGAEVWRMADGEWEQVLFPGGETNGVYGNPSLNNVWGRMIVFNDRLYFGFSSGFQGNFLGSTGCEIWRYDGTAWEAVISDQKDVDESGTLTALSGCDAGDGNPRAEFTDSTKSWLPGQWQGAALRITSGSGMLRKFKIIDNSADTLTVQQNEAAGTLDEPGSDSAEESVCAATTYTNQFPKYSYTLGEVLTADAYAIEAGPEESGFGEVWNKTITDMAVYKNALYVSTGLNYEYGAQVWVTADGDNWAVTEPANSFGNYHPEQPGYPGGRKAVSSSIPSLCVSDVSGEEALYAGGMGTSGPRGSCSRMARLTDTGWELIVDGAVDDNDEGTNENGFGDGLGCTMTTGNFMPWDLVAFNGLLHAGINTLAGVRVLYTPSADPQDGSWFYSVGGDAELPAGFDGIINAGYPDSYQNLAPNLFVFSNTLYAGLVTLFLPEYGATEEFLTGSQIWKTPDGITWTRVTGNGLGDRQVVIFEAFAEHNGQLYVAGSKGGSSSPTGLGGVKIFRMSPPPGL